MTNEQIVSEIRNGYSVTDYMQLLYESNLLLIKKFIKPFAAYEPMENLLQEDYFGLWEAVQRYESSKQVRFMTYAHFWIYTTVRNEMRFYCPTSIQYQGETDKLQQSCRQNKERTGKRAKHSGDCGLYWHI